GRTGLSARAEADRVARGVPATSDVAPLAACAAVVAKVAPPARPEVVAAARDVLAEAKARERAGRFREALALALPAALAARGLGYRPLLAEAALLAGWLEARLADYPAAQRSGEEAVVDATAAGDDEPAAAAESFLV